MIKRERKPTAPGTLLLELFLKPRGITISAFAEAVGFSRKHISNIIHGRARIDAQLAARIGVVLGTSSRVWLNGQSAIDAWQAEKELKNWKPAVTFKQPAIV
ncbi:MAG: HigA family addiction module antitoxin [Alphaproteobacteria bacterium]|nr:HigA family addiction module antitoxin [Alphaproteobacteria bacterium]